MDQPSLASAAPADAAEPRALPLPGDGVVCRTLPDGAVLFATASEVYFGLNVVGAQIWEMLPTHRTLDALCGELERRYVDVDPRTIRADVLELLAELEAQGLVRPADTRAPGDAADAPRAAEADRPHADRVG